VYLSLVLHPIVYMTHTSVECMYIMYVCKYVCMYVYM